MHFNKVLLVFFLSSIFSISSNAATYYSIASGNWNATSTWSLTSGGSAAAAYPVAGDVVTIERGYTVTLNITTAACASLQLGTSNGTGTMTFNASDVLTVSGNVTLGATNAGSLNFASGGTLYIGGNFTTPILGTFTTGSGTINCNGTSAQSIPALTYFNLIISNTGATVTASGNIAFSNLGTLTINTSAILDMSTYSLSVSSGTITSAVNGTLQTESTSATPITGMDWSHGNAATGTVIFAGSSAQTIPSGCTFYTLNINNSSTGVTLGGATSTSNLILTNGPLITTAANVLTVTSPSPYAVEGGSTSSYVNGPLILTIPPYAVAGTYTFPVGVTGGTNGPYYPVTLNIIQQTTTNSMTIKVRAFSGASGGSAGTGMATISTAEYWSVTNSSSLSGGTYIFSFGRTASLSGFDIVGYSTTLASSYTTLHGFTSGTSISNLDNYNPSATTTYFVLGTSTSIAPTISTPTSANIAQTTAIMGGNITSIGSTNVTKVGIIYCSTGVCGASPTAATVEGSGTTFTFSKLESQLDTFNTGVFYYPVTGLKAGTTYNYVAFATNSHGTSYSALGTAFTTVASKALYVNDSVAGGQDIYTTAVGNDNNAGTKSAPFATLTKALSIATAGDTINIDAGTWATGTTYTAINDATTGANPQNITLDGLTIIGVNKSGVNYTIFNNKYTVGEAMCVLANNVTIKNLTLENYYWSGSSPSYGACITLGNNGSTIIKGITLENLEIIGCGATTPGANCSYPIYISQNVSATITGVTTMCNQSKSGGNLYAGGIYIYGGNSGSCSQYLTIANCALAYNYSDGSNGIVNIYSNNNTLDITRQVVIKNCYFSHNNNEVYNTSASGADIFQTGGVLTVEDCKFDYGENNNTSSYSGGSITLGKYIYSAAIRRCSFTNYTTNNYANGGAIAMGGSSNTYLIGNALIDSCYFSGNSVTNGTGNDVYCSNNYNNLTLGYNIFNSSATNITTAASTHGDLFIGYSGTSSSIVSGTNVNQFPMTATTYTASPTVPTISYTSCSSFSVTLLPISLTSFIGVCNGDQVVIMWQTATETGNHYFNLERSLDGTNFYSIGTIEGAGTSDQVHNYSFIDTSKIRGITYYRILQVDFDGKESSSAPISVDHSCASTDPFDMRIYPNPAHNWVYLECKIPSPCSGQIELFNDLGQLVLSQPTSFNYPGIQSESIDVSHLAQGLYIIRFTLNQQAFVFKFVKI